MIESLFRRVLISLLTFGFLTACAQEQEPVVRTTAEKPAIICDLGGVLMTTNKAAAFSHVGLLRFLVYYLSTWPYTRHPNTLLLETLDHVKPRYADEIPAREEHGILLPQLMCDWLKGTLHPQEILDHVQSQINHASSCFACPAEYTLFNGMLPLAFHPETFVKTRTFIPEGIAFIQECRDRGHKVYLLSNWDPYSFKLMQQEYPEFCEFFDGIVISGECGLLKPDPNIFRHILNKYELEPANCLFLDDQRENVIMAQKLGIPSMLITREHGLLSSSLDFTPILKELDSQKARPIRVPFLPIPAIPMSVPVPPILP